MILGFKKQFEGGKPTHFKEKILECVKPTGKYKPKKHTMRAGKRFKKGDKLHLAYGVRSKEYKQFNEGVEGLQECTGVQECVIKWKRHDYTVSIDGRILPTDEVEELAVNDGFDDIVQFLTWFCKSQVLQIIHWTKLKY